MKQHRVEFRIVRLRKTIFNQKIQIPHFIAVTGMMRVIALAVAALSVSQAVQVSLKPGDENFTDVEHHHVQDAKHVAVKVLF